MKIQFTMKDIFEVMGRLWIGLICLSFLGEKVTEHNFVVRVIGVVLLIWTMLPLVKEEKK